MTNTMATKATLKNAPISAQKMRLLADQIRGASVERGLDTLQFSLKGASRVLKKLLESAIANAEQAGADIDELMVKTVFVDEAATYRRFRARAKGRAARILKRNCHVTIVLDEK